MCRSADVVSELGYGLGLKLVIVVWLGIKVGDVLLINYSLIKVLLFATSADMHIRNPLFNLIYHHHHRWISRSRPKASISVRSR